MMAETELLTAQECAAYRRCSVRKLDRERAEGRGCLYVRIDGRIFYRRSDVDRFIAANVRGGDVRVAGATIATAPCRCGRPQKSTNPAVVS